MGEIIAAVISLLVAGPAGALAHRTAARRVKVEDRSTDHARIKALEDRVDAVEARNARLWSYNRHLIDHIYRELPPPPPPAPEGLVL